MNKVLILVFLVFLMAFVAGRDMGGRFDGAAGEFRLGVAGDTLARCAAKDAGAVTAFTLDIAMSPGKGEAGGKVVEGGVVSDQACGCSPHLWCCGCHGGGDGPFESNIRIECRRAGGGGRLCFAGLSSLDVIERNPARPLAGFPGAVVGEVTADADPVAAGGA